MKTRYRLALLVLVLILSTGCDQATKQIATSELRFSAPQSYAGDLFRLQYTQNPGAFLSLGAGLPEEIRLWLFVAGVGALLAGMLAIAVLNSRLGPLSVTGLALFLGGGLGNLADRALHGNVVVDFMNVGIGSLRTGVFNVADLCIVAGATLLIGGTIWPIRPKPTTISEIDSSPGPEQQAQR